MASNEICHPRKSIYKKKKRESLPFLKLGKPKIKSIEISTQGFLGTGKGV